MGLLLLLATAVAMAAGGCRRAGPTIKYPIGSMLYTQTNLHPDEARGTLSSVNYQQQGLIPLCTPIRLDDVNRREMRFTTLSNGRQYRYEFHRSLREPVDVHMDLYFAPGCDDSWQSTLGEADQAGIRDGRIYEGMTRRGVILAIGYPPSHATPNINDSVWRYWSNRMNTFEVHFNGDVVLGFRE